MRSQQDPSPDAPKDDRGAPSSTDLTRKALTLAGVSVWTWEASRDSITWSPSPWFADGLDSTHETPTSLEQLIQSVEAECQEAFRVALHRHWEQRQAFDLETRFVNASGDTCLARVTGQASWNAEGEVVAMAGCLQKTTRPSTDSTRSYDSLLGGEDPDNETGLRSLVDHVSIGVLELDPEGRIRSVNSVGLAMLGQHSPDNIVGAPFGDWLKNEDQARLQDLLDSPIPGEAVDFEFVTCDGDSPKTLTARFLPLGSQQGAITRFLGMMSDVTSQRQAEAELRRRDERQRLTQRIAGFGVWEWDLESNQVFLTDEMKRILDLPDVPTSFPIDTLTSRFDPVHLPTWRDAVAKCLEEGRELDEEFRLLSADETVCWVAIAADVRCDDGERPTHILGVMMDVTQRKRGETALRESEERFQLAVQGSADGLWDWNIATGQVFFSARYKELLGFQAFDPFPPYVSSFTDALHPDDRAAVWEQVEDHLEKREPYDREIRLRTKQGDFRWYRARGQAVWSAEGIPQRMAGSIQDVTARREAERLLRDVIDLVPHQIFAKDAEGRFVLSNRKHAEDLGRVPDDVVGRRQIDLTSNREEAARFLADDQRVLDRRQPFLVPEEAFTRDDGGRLRLQTHKIPICLRGSSDQAPDGVLGVSIDITALKETEEQLRRSEEKFRSLVETTSDWVWEMNAERKYIYSNGRLREILGYAVEELPEIQLADLLHPDECEPVFEMMDRAVQQRCGWRNFVLRLRDGSGQWRYLESNAAPVVNEAGELIGFRGIDRDITDRKLAEDELNNARSLLDAAIESSPAGIMILNATGTVMTVNNAARAISGDPDYQFHDRSFDIHLRNFKFLQPDGSPMRTERQPLTLALGGETTRNVDLIVEQPTGKQRWLLANAAPVRDAEGRLIAAVAVVSDVTEQKDSERQREALIQELEEKNAELERFTYTVSHDLKSPLITVSGFVGLLERELESGETELAKSRIERIRRAAEQMSRLLDELLELSRIGRLANVRESVSFSDIAQEAVALVAGPIEAKHIEVRIQAEMPSVLVDRKRFVEVFQNLIDNACRFAGDEEAPIIEIGMRTEANKSVFFVRDNGIGIPQVYQEKVLGLFEQLDPKKGGTGIGLAIVKRIIEVHDGEIWIESEGDGQGAAICFTLGAALG